MQICELQNGNATKNLTYRELWKASGGISNCFQIDDGIINGLQFLRDYYKAPIYPTSTVRSKAYNLAIGGVADSRHQPDSVQPDGDGIDWSFSDKKHALDYQYQVLNKGPVFLALRDEYGWRAFGLYDTHFHADNRAKQHNKEDEFGTYRLWDHRITTKGEENIFQAIWEAWFGPDDSPAPRYGKWIWIFVILSMVAVGAYFATKGN